MKTFDDKLMASLRIFSGLESLEQDIKMLEAYHTQAVGCGLESLDNPAGRLIEMGLTDRYGDHFVAGTGLEGIGNLLTSLKTAVDKLKGSFKGKTPEQIISKPTDDAKKALTGKFNSNFWGKYKKSEVAEVVKPKGLLAIVKPGSWADVKAQIDAAIASGENTAKTAADDLVKYWSGVLPLFNKLQKETNAVVLLDICAEIIKYSETTTMAEAPEEFKQKGEAGKLEALTDAEADDVVTYLVNLLDRSKKIYGLTDHMYDVGVTDDDAHGYLDNLKDIKEAPVRRIYKSFGRVELTNEISGYVEEVRDYIFEAITGLEDWVTESRD